MDSKEVMSVYNAYERIEIELPGFTKLTSNGVTKFSSDTNQGGFISFYDFAESEVDAAIAREIAYFSQHSSSFEWKTYSTDSPVNIGERLLAHGFQAEASESFMVLDLATVVLTDVAHDSITEVHDLEGIQDAMAVQEQVWASDQSSHLANLHFLKQTQPDSVSIYVIYEQGIPVSSAWIIFNGDSPFAGIWGGSTLKAYRGKGYYTALLQKRIQDAKNRGKRYLTIDASAMSRPIVEKYGFHFIAETVPYLYQFER
ncbi:GNAT family N-acetyltransferase [Photobacterium galatheae]|uniref:Acetyltransferase n=1 Tax=Photobacterium galatheae TaxID=1654360 RepID=A0A066RMB5_9GAMM|nr:GNAT family N-acetyltransferase [Photobacterium galatheae]KDM91494.1 acetyltransferase [Photobacterium galatheae]MCM0149567.1 GNAT family N-acetyltransferase [Photobacterium galatheae]